jgi:glucuronosyltransferase
MPDLEKIVRERFNYKDMPPLIEMEKRMVLMLLNQHPAIDFAEPVQPNLIQVGGLQIVDPKPLKEVRFF